MTTEAQPVPEAPATSGAPSGGTEAPSEAPQQPQTPPAETGGGQDGGQESTQREGPKTAREMRERIREKSRGKRDSGKDSVAKKINRPRDESGRFRSESEAPSGEGEEGGERAAEEASGESPEAVDGSSSPDTRTDGDGGLGEPPEGMVRIPLPEGHPLRDRGRTYMDFAAEDEEYGRHMVKQAIRSSEMDRYRQELERARKEAEETRLRAVQREEEAKFWREHGEEFFGPDFKATYEDLKRAYGDGEAERYRRGVLADAQQKLAERQQQVTQREQNRVLVTKAQQFRAKAHEVAPKFFPEWGPADIDNALRTYGQQMNRTGAREFDPGEFRKVAQRLYAQHPKVREQMLSKVRQRREEELEKAREGAREELRQKEVKRLREVASSRRRNPMQGTPRTETGRTVGDGDEGPKTAKEMRESIRQRARGRR